MYMRMKRRRFGSLVIASAATVAISQLPRKGVAQTRQLLYGISVNPQNRGLVLLALDITTGQIQNPRLLSVTLNSGERLSSFIVMTDGSLGFTSATARAVAGRKQTRPSRLLSADRPQGLPAIQGLSQNRAIESLVEKRDGKLLSLVSLNQGSPPFDLADIDKLTGKVTLATDVDLPSNRRFSNLIECADGSIYATTMGSEGHPGLVKIDRQNKSIVSGKAKVIYLPTLTFNKEPLENDISGLACSATNQVFALADPAYEGVNSLFSVNPQTGVMRFIVKFPVEKIAFSRR